MRQRLTIGEFAQRCGLSRSALRFYDQNDLLRPDLVDQQTGYRYYAAGQVAQAVLVRRLRAADLPVGAVRRYLTASTAERRAVLDAHLTSVRERASEVESTIAELHLGLSAGDDGREDRFCSVAPARFGEALEQVSFAIADPEVRAELGAVWVETREDSLRLVTTDSYRMAVRDLVPEHVGADGLRGVIDAEPAAALSVALAAARTLTLSQDADGTLFAAIDAERMTIGHAGAEFPDYERVLQGVPAGHHATCARDDVVRAIRHPLDTPHLCLELEPERLIVQAQRRRRTVAGIWSGPPMRMFVDARYFAEAVDATVGPDLVIEASDPLQPITLRSADTGTFSVLTMPISPPDGE